MIVYVVSENPDDRVLSKASQALKAGRLICLPAESNWVVLADPFNKQGVENLYRFRHVDDSKHFTLFCADIAQAAEVAHISDAHFRLLKRLIPGSYTFIFRAQKKTTKHLKASRTDHQVGVRFPPTDLLRKLLATHEGPAIGTHVDVSMIPDHDVSMSIWAGLIEETFGGQLDLILDPGEVEFTGSTTVLDVTEEGIPQLVRDGAGKWPV